jgi:hypothetical protein
MIKQYIHHYSTILRQPVSAVILLAMLIFPSCSPPEKQLTLPTPTVIADVSQNNVKVTILMVPNTFKLNQDIFLNIKVETRLATTATIPEMSSYCTGFKLISEFTSPTVTKGNKTTYSHHLQLTPQISTLYAIEPFAIIYKNRSYNPALTGSLKIPKIILTPQLPKTDSDDIIVNFSPIESKTTQKTKAAKIIATLLLLVIISLQAAKHHLNNRTTNIPIPRSTALTTLQKLLNSNLIANKEFTEFYYALTGLVRCYIEEILEITATHQTSEELIKTLQKDKRIDKIMLSDLKEFFKRADLIKFATLNPSAAEIANDIAWAEKYIDTDFKKNDMEVPEL